MADKKKQNFIADRITNAIIGASVADSPAAATASGWQQRNGEWRQKRTKATDKLGENLELVSMAADGTGGLAVIKDIATLGKNIVLHPRQTLRTVKNVISTVKRAGRRILRKANKQLTAKKRIENVRNVIAQEMKNSQAAHDKYDDLRYRARVFHRRISRKTGIQFQKPKTIEKKKSLNWDKMTVKDAQAAADKYVKEKPVLKPVKVRLITKKGTKKDVEIAGVNKGYTPSVTTGDYSVPDFQTGDVVNGTLDIKTSGGSVEPIKMPTNGQLFQNTALGQNEARTVTGNKELANVLKRNIEYLKKEIPGFKPFGSSVGEAENAFVHNTHDIDGYITTDVLNGLKQKGLVTETNPNNTYLYRVNNGAFGESGNVDLNIISIGKDGQAGNSRTIEMYRQFYPLEYQKQVKELADSKISNIRMLDENGNVLSEQQLLDSYNPLTKTILDSGEIDFTKNAKTKHAGRFLEYLAGDNPEAVHRALALESKRAGALGHLLPKMKFTNPEENVKILQRIGFTGDIGTVSNDAAKMQNVLDYWYLSARRNYRTVGFGDLYGNNGSAENLIRNLTDWNASKNLSGGHARGFGLNSTIDGPSGHIGTAVGYLQPHIPGLQTETDPNKVIDLVNRANGIGLSSEEKIKIAQALNNNSFSPMNSEYSHDLLSQLPSSGEEIKKGIEKISRDYGINAFAGLQYGEGRYSGISRRLHPEKDAIGTLLREHDSPYPSWSARMNTANGSSPVFPDVVWIKKPEEESMQSLFSDLYKQKMDYYSNRRSILGERDIVLNRKLQSYRDNLAQKIKLYTLGPAGLSGGIGGLYYFDDRNRIAHAKKDFIHDYRDYADTVNDLLNIQRKKVDHNYYNYDYFPHTSYVTIPAKTLSDSVLQLDRNADDYLEPNSDFIYKNQHSLKQP